LHFFVRSYLTTPEGITSSRKLERNSKSKELGTKNTKQMSCSLDKTLNLTLRSRWTSFKSIINKAKPLLRGSYMKAPRILNSNPFFLHLLIYSLLPSNSIPAWLTSVLKQQNEIVFFRKPSVRIDWFNLMLKMKMTLQSSRSQYNSE